MRHLQGHVLRRTITVIMVEIVADRYDHGTYKSALLHVMQKCNKKGRKTGFEADTFEQSYQAYRRFKTTHSRNITEHRHDILNNAAYSDAAAMRNILSSL